MATLKKIQHFGTQNSLKTKGKKTNGTAFSPSFSYLYSAEGSKQEPSKDKTEERHRERKRHTRKYAPTHPGGTV